MRRLAAAAALACTAVLLIAAGATGSAKKTVEVGDDFFNPTSLSISKGTKVAFNWTGSDKHNVTKAKGPGRGFSSGSTDADGVNFTHKFKKAGKYKLICTIHDEMKMTVKVK